MHSTTTPTQKKEFLRFLYIYALNPVQHMVLPFATSLFFLPFFFFFFFFFFFCVPRKGTGSESNDQGCHSFVFCYLPSHLTWDIRCQKCHSLISCILPWGHSSRHSHPSLTGSESAFQRLQVLLFVPLRPRYHFLSFPFLLLAHNHLIHLSSAISISLVPILPESSLLPYLEIFGGTKATSASIAGKLGGGNKKIVLWPLISRECEEKRPFPLSLHCLTFELFYVLACWVQTGGSVYSLSVLNQSPFG